jgi:hypothetical protein
MDSHSFERRVTQVDRRVREIAPQLAGDTLRETGPLSASWERGGSRAILTQHDGAVPHLELTLHTGRDDHPDAQEIGFDDADAVDMIAQPIAELLARAT